MTDTTTAHNGKASLFSELQLVVGSEPVDIAKVFDNVVVLRPPSKNAFAKLAKINGSEPFDITKVIKDAFDNVVPLRKQQAYLAPDREQLTQFAETLFKHATPGTYVSLRSFPDKGEKNDKPFKITPHKLNGDFNALIDDAWDAANLAANATEKIVFCPPVATFTNRKHAGEGDLAEGPVISVECDKHAQEGRKKLKALLGPATIVVESGGEWTDPTGKVRPRLHVHYRLIVPARGEDALKKLKLARKLATAIVGGDTSNVTAVHPIRWPGSWHRKNDPKLCRIVEINANPEIDLDEALEILKKAAPDVECSEHTANEDKQADVDLIYAAMEVIPNLGEQDGDQDEWNEWNNTGMAIFNATGGDPRGLEAFMMWSRKSPKNKDANTKARWKHYFKHPPRQGPKGIGAGSIIHWANEADPGGWRDAYDEANWKRIGMGFAEAKEQREQKQGTQHTKVSFDDLVASAKQEQEQSDKAKASAKGAALFDPWAEFIVPEFPLDILPPVVQEFIVAKSEVIGCDQAAMAMCVMGAFSGAIDHRVELKLMRHGDWYATARLWVLLSGASSLKKTPPINAATKPLEDYQRELLKTYRIQQAQYLQGKNDEGEELKEPEKPVEHIVVDTTIEALGIILERSGRGTLVKRDELSGWLGSMEQYTGKGGGNAVRAFWIKAFDGGYHPVHRVGRDSIYIDNLSASILGGLQPNKMAEHGLLKLTSDGLLQRFIPTVMIPVGFPIDRPCDTQAYNDLVRKLLSATEPDNPFSKFAEEGDRRPMGLRTHELTLTDAALEVMNDLRLYLHQLERQSGGISHGFQSFVGKMAGLSGSLALILHMAADPTRNGIHKQVSEKTAKSVHRLVKDFIIPHAHIFYRTAEGDANGDSLRKLASWILTSNKDKLVTSDLTSNIRDFRGLTLFEVNERVSSLVAAGWLSPVDMKARLHKTWDVNPIVFEQFDAQAKKEEAEKAALANLMNQRKKRR